MATVHPIDGVFLVFGVCRCEIEARQRPSSALLGQSSPSSSLIVCLPTLCRLSSRTFSEPVPGGKTKRRKRESGTTGTVGDRVAALVAVQFPSFSLSPTPFPLSGPPPPISIHSLPFLPFSPRRRSLFIHTFTFIPFIPSHGLPFFFLRLLLLVALLLSTVCRADFHSFHPNHSVYVHVSPFFPRRTSTRRVKHTSNVLQNLCHHHAPSNHPKSPPSTSSLSVSSRERKKERKEERERSVRGRGKRKTGKSRRLSLSVHKLHNSSNGALLASFVRP